MRSNCFIYALRMWHRHGGYIIIRRSRYLWIPHFLWAPPGGLDGAELRHFVPVSPSRRPWMIWRALRFEGIVKNSDKRENPLD